MARVKMFARGLAQATGWAAAAGGTLVAAYAGSAAAAHLGSWIEWR